MASCYYFVNSNPSCEMPFMLFFKLSFEWCMCGIKLILNLAGPQFSDKSQILQTFSRPLLEQTGLVFHLPLKRVELW